MINCFNVWVHKFDGGMKRIVMVQPCDPYMDIWKWYLFSGQTVNWPSSSWLWYTGLSSGYCCRQRKEIERFWEGAQFIEIVAMVVLQAKKRKKILEASGPKNWRMSECEKCEADKGFFFFFFLLVCNLMRMVPDDRVVQALQVGCIFLFPESNRNWTLIDVPHRVRELS